MYYFILSVLFLQNFFYNSCGFINIYSFVCNKHMSRSIYCNEYKKIHLSTEIYFPEFYENNWTEGEVSWDFEEENKKNTSVDDDKNEDDSKHYKRFSYNNIDFIFWML